jgi:hypothetical protein
MRQSRLSRFIPTRIIPSLFVMPESGSIDPHTGFSLPFQSTGVDKIQHDLVVRLHADGQVPDRFALVAESRPCQQRKDGAPTYG